MSTIRLKKVRDLLTDWFTSHEFVNESKFGNFLEMYASNQIDHSCVVIDLVRVPDLTRSKVGYQFIMTYADRMYTDRRNETDIKNDCVRVFHDFVVAASNDASLRTFITGLTTGNIELFAQRSGDLVAGGVMTVTINIASDQNKCAIPINPTPVPPPPSCSDANIEINEVQTFTVPSGGTQNINLLDANGNPIAVDSVSGDDVTLSVQASTYEITDTDGTVLYSGTIPLNTSLNQIIQNATAVLKNTDNTTLGTTSILAEGSEDVIAPDATFSINSTQVATIPSGDSDSIQVRQEQGATQIGSLQGQYWRVDDSQITINTNEVTENVPATDPKNFNLLDANGDAIAVDSVSGDDVTLDITPDSGWWERNPDWLPMPTVTAGDNVFYGLFAVYENGFNAVAIDKNGTASLIDWGDGTTATSTGVEDHVYDYATVSGIVSVDKWGRNYKQVMVQINIPSNCSNLSLSEQTTPTTGTSLRSQNWLDIVADFTGTTAVALRPSTNIKYKSILLERVKVLGKILGVNNASLSNCVSLKVWDNDMSTFNLGNANSGFRYAGDFRNASGNPIDFFCDSDMRFMFSEGGITKLGNITYTGGSSISMDNMFRNSAIQEVGDISALNVSSIQRIFNDCFNFYKVGTITVDTTLTDISVAVINTPVQKVEFVGDMSGVTNTSIAFRDCFSLYRLLLPNITVGFDISDTQITGQNLQDLFDSLGTASGSQTITLPNFTSGEPTGIATGKGYTIAYA